MNANDLLAQIAGINEAVEVDDPTREEVYEIRDEIDEINYEDIPQHVEHLELDVVGDQAVLEDEPQLPRTRRGRPPASRNQRGIARRELLGLEFINPGDGMSKMLPDLRTLNNSNRPRRETHLPVTSTQSDRDQHIHHDRNGKLVIPPKNGQGHTDVVDLCDCCDINCTGCQWPCENCKSRKCILKCRQNRNEIIVRIEEMYTVEGAFGHEICDNPLISFTIRDPKR